MKESSDSSTARRALLHDPNASALGGCHEVGHTLFNHGGNSRFDEIQLCGIDIDADQFVTIPNKTGQGDGAHVAQSKNANFQARTP